MKVEIGKYVVTDSYVQEWGTTLRWSPDRPKGYQFVDGRRVSLLAYEAFGSDLNRALECADRWCERARGAWEQAHGDEHTQRVQAG